MEADKGVRRDKRIKKTVRGALQKYLETHKQVTNNLLEHC